MRSAKKFVRMKKVGRIGQIWHKRDIDTAIVKRNELVDHRHAKPEEYRAAAQRVESLIAEKKREIWRDKVFKNKDAKQMWSLFHKLGAPNAERGKTMSYNVTMSLTDRQKADAYIAEYAKNSKLTLGKEVKRKVNATL